MERTELDSPPRSDHPSLGEAALPRASSRALSRTEPRAARGEARDGMPEARADVKVPTGLIAPGGTLPPIPAKRYFTIGEVSELCGVKPYVLRYWEQEFSQLRPMKRRGNRRYYQHHEVLLIRRIRELLYEQGFTISGARNQLQDHPGASASKADVSAPAAELLIPRSTSAPEVLWSGPDLIELSRAHPQAAAELRVALLSIRELLG
jgi:DNA-binding transcriptional MerR regulator